MSTITNKLVSGVRSEFLREDEFFMKNLERAYEYEHYY